MTTSRAFASPPSRTLPGGSALLRAALKLDALVSGVNGAAYLAAAGPLEDLLGVPASALRGGGAFLVLYGAAVWLVARRRPAPAPGAVIAANAVWVLASLVVAATAVWSPTTVGTVWTVLQAGSVGAFAVAQAVGLRGSR